MSVVLVESVHTLDQHHANSQRAKKKGLTKGVYNDICCSVAVQGGWTDYSHDEMGS